MIWMIGLNYLITKKNQIVNEEGASITKEKMLEVITERSSDRDWSDRSYIYNSISPYHSEEHFHKSNMSERGPNNLLRTNCDNNHCIGHGDGTYDLITGEFS